MPRWWQTFPAKAYFENEAYIPRTGYDKDEIFKDNEVLRAKLSELYAKVKAE